MTQDSRVQEALAARGWKLDMQAARCGVPRLCWRPPGAGPDLEAYLYDEVVAYLTEVYWYTGEGLSLVYRGVISPDAVRAAARAEAALLRADAVLRLGGQPGLENPE